jgi:hypothetical protein
LTESYQGRLELGHHLDLAAILANFEQVLAIAEKIGDEIMRRYVLTFWGLVQWGLGRDGCRAGARAGPSCSDPPAYLRRAHVTADAAYAYRMEGRRDEAIAPYRSIAVEDEADGGRLFAPTPAVGRAPRSG